MARKTTTFVVVSWALVALCAGFIFFMSSNTDTGLNDDLGLFSRIFQDLKALQAQLLGPEVDVVSSIAHFCEYTVLGALLANALRCHMPLRRACLVAVACASPVSYTHLRPSRAGSARTSWRSTSPATRPRRAARADARLFSWPVTTAARCAPS